ncbi:hypothetical protein B2J93_5154 [Marssonina coronariae]|uniref:Uncharacterized protein n=1 Tax=Diplocarpon coronariae TaxID=2795749 RepID=A0A218ZHC8_9HELO|nr:hypothetical protein B2J93_5154 [Marssonina coronariae]
MSATNSPTITIGGTETQVADIAENLTSYVIIEGSGRTPPPNTNPNPREEAQTREASEGHAEHAYGCIMGQAEEIARLEQRIVDLEEAGAAKDAHVCRLRRDADESRELVRRHQEDLVEISDVRRNATGRVPPGVRARARAPVPTVSAELVERLQKTIAEISGVTAEQTVTILEQEKTIDSRDRTNDELVDRFVALEEQLDEERTCHGRLSAEILRLKRLLRQQQRTIEAQSHRIRMFENFCSRYRETRRAEENSGPERNRVKREILSEGERDNEAGRDSGQEERWAEVSRKRRA